MLDEEDDPAILSAVIWSLSQVGGEDVRTYLENLLDKTEDEDEILSSKTPSPTCPSLKTSNSSICWPWTLTRIWSSWMNWKNWKSWKN